MALDEESYVYEDTFIQSSIAALILRINNMFRKPVIDMELNKTLDSFMEKLNETQHYLSQGIFNMKFAEAGLFLQNAAALYGKKVDSLWDSTLQYQMELCSYNKSPEENEEEAAKLVQRLNRRKRKKTVIQDTDTSTFLYEDLNGVCIKANEFLKERCAVMESRVEMNALNDQNLNLNDNVSLDRTLSSQNSEGNNNKYISGFRFPIDQQIDNLATDEKICKYNDLYLNSTIPYLEMGDCSDICGNSESPVTSRTNDWLLQKYVTERRFTYKMFWTRMLASDFDAFKRTCQHRSCFVDNNLTSNLDVRARSLCPNRYVVNVTRLPNDLMSEYANSNENHVRALVQDLLTKERQADVTNTIRKNSERISEADSLFHDGPFDELDVTSADHCDAAYLTQKSTADSGICCSEGQGLSTIMLDGDNLFSQEDLSNVIPIEQLQNTSKEIVASTCVEGSSSADIVENIGRNECVDVGAISTIQNCNGEVVARAPVAVAVCHKNNLTLLKNLNEKQNLKRKPPKDDDSDDEKRKRKRFRWLKTTTALNLQFERFYRQNYEPEFEEGNAVENDDSDWDVDPVPDTNIDDLENLDVSAEEIIANAESVLQSTAIEDSVNAPEDCGNASVQANGSAVAFDSALASESDPNILEHTVATLTDSQVCDSAQINSSDITNPVVSASGVTERTDNTAVLSASCAGERTDSISDPAGSNNTNVPMSTVAPYEKERIDRLRAVAEWRKFIDPKLKRTEQDSKFDIHEYGTRIMDAIPLGKQLRFSELATGKAPAEVARLFLASLQLANTYNVELISPLQGLANDKLELKLLSRERYHEHLDEYEAPSENTFRERLARVKALNAGVPLHSTPHSSKCPSDTKSTAKRQKLQL